MGKKIILVILVTLLLTLNINYSFADDTGYYIKSMDVQVNVNDKREYNITETIKVNFNEERHGIIRKIHINNNISKRSQIRKVNNN